MTTSYPEPIFVDLSDLRIHPLSLKVYGAEEDVSDLVSSITQHGILRPLVITADNQVISGKRRLQAAQQVGLTQAPIVVSPLTDPDEIELFLLEDNRTREKTNEQKAREFIERLRIEKKLAKIRQQEGRRLGGQTAGRGRPKNDAAQPLPDADDNSSDRNRATLPGSYPADEIRARDLAAAPIGWKSRTAEKASAVIQYADETGDHSLVELLNQKSANSAYARLQDIQNGVKPPPFAPQISNVWSFPGPTPGLGTDYPGRIPGDLLRNVLWYFTQADDQVVDLFAGGGVTMDAVAWWNEQPDLWTLRCLSYDLVPSREGIMKNDALVYPYLPNECQDASLIFLDPPYWKQKRGEYSADPTNLANLSLDDFYKRLVQLILVALHRLRTGGHLVLLIGATQSDRAFIDHTLEITMQLAERQRMALRKNGRLVLVQRIIVPYTTQQFSGADVAQGRKSRMLLKGYRDLLIWQKKEW